MSRPITIVARLEFAVATRQKWVRFFAAAFALLALAAAWSSGAARELGAPEGVERTTVALSPLVLLLVPLAALLLGVSGQARDSEGEDFLFMQPLGRFEVVLGRWLGELAALSGAVILGLGAGGAFLVAAVGAAGLPGYLFFVLIAILLGAVFLALAAAVAAATRTKAAALAVSAFLWFLFALLYDGAALALAGFLTGRAGARVLFLSVFGNPADLARVLALSICGTPHLFGAAGEAWSRFLGGPLAASLLAGTALLAWIAAPLLVAGRAISQRDL